MLKENRLVYFSGPEAGSYEDEPELVSQPMEAGLEAAEQMKPSDLEYAKGVAEIAMQVETGDMDDAAKNFYELFLKTPGKMKGYVDLMIATTTPLTYLLRNAPVLGLPHKLQTWLSGKTIDAFFNVKDGLKKMSDDSSAYQALEGMGESWNQLDPKKKEEVKKLLSTYLRGIN